MPRILLVDDEPLTTRTLQTLILDEMPDLEVTSVNSSAQALELIQKNIYDVVVTDVAMPRYSGLDLLERIKKQGTLCYVIILTAYNSFDYAYQASHYDDVRFILKIEPPEVIMDAIRSGLKRIRQYYSSSQDNERLRQFVQETLPLLRQTLLEKVLLYGEDLPDAAARESSGIHMVPEEDVWLAVTGRITAQEKQQEICYLVLALLQHRGIRTDVWYGETSLVFLMQPGVAGMDLAAELQGELDRLIEEVGSAAGLSFVLSSVPVPWIHIGEAVSFLVGWAGRSLESDRILRKDPLSEEKRSVAISDILRWHRFIEQRNLPLLIASIREGILREGYPQGRQNIAVLLQMQLRESFGENCFAGLNVQGFPAESVLFHRRYDTPEAWLSSLEALFHALFSGNRIRRMTETEEMLSRMNQYIQEHYADSISLTQIAEHFNYNSSYLSRIYKQNMHEGVNEHIIRIRIEAACRLLQDSGMSVSEIAGQCGFQTTKYFITVFKRVLGITPKSWRDTHLAGHSGNISTI